ncbi:hypothetical protein [Kribbella hippodromi]
MPPRLATYALRTADLSQAGRPVGTLLVEPELYTEQTSGALWWRRWSQPQWAAHLWLDLPGLHLEVDATDTLIAPGDLEAELDDWDANRFTFAGQSLTLHWRPSTELASE